MGGVVDRRGLSLCDLDPGDAAVGAGGGFDDLARCLAERFAVAGGSLAMTATDSVGNTSEFSRVLTVQ